MIEIRKILEEMGQPGKFLDHFTRDEARREVQRLRIQRYRLIAALEASLEVTWSNAVEKKLGKKILAILKGESK